MYKSKKHWVVASATVLAILGSASAVSADETGQSVTSSIETEAVLAVADNESEQDGTKELEVNKEALVTNDVTEEEKVAEKEAEVVSETEVQASETNTDQATAEKTDTELVSEQQEAKLSNATPADAGIKLRRVVDNSSTSNANQTTDTSTGTSAVKEEPLVSASVERKTLTIKYNGIIKNQEKIKFAVWSDNKGQDDIVWYDANNLGAAYVDLSKHKDYGLYHVHTYSFVPNTAAKGLNALTITVAKPEIQTNINKTSAGNFEILINNVPDTITSVLVPVWSAKNGQDDIKWYQATKTTASNYKVNVSVRDHKNDTGLYNVHIYGQSLITGGLVGLTATSGFTNADSRANATVSMVNYAENKTSFDIVVAGNSNTKTVKAVSIAVWSQDKGQDDLKWYTPTVSGNKATATVNIANHSNTSDYYIVHTYVDYTDGTRSGTNLGSYKITKPVSKTVVNAELTSAGISLQVTSTSVNDYSKVKFAVWSDENGQDDIKWYNADKTGKAVASYENHKGFGNYNIHTYSFETGKAVGLNGRTITIAKPKVSTKIDQKDENTYTVQVSNVPLYISSVTVPVWTSKNGQDDIKWHKTTQENTSTYTATISVKDHNHETGQYNVHIYGYSKIGGSHLMGLAGTDGFVVKNVKTEEVKLSVSNYNANAGTLDIVLSETTNSKSIKSISVAAWSEENQKNIYWYTSSEKTNGQVKVTVNERNHGYIKSDYTVHAYVDYTDGTRTGHVAGTYALNADKKGSASQGDYEVINKVVYLDAGHGGSDSGAYYYNTAEKTLNLSMQKLIKAKLEAAGYTVVTTRTDDTYVGLTERSQKVNASASDIFISIHFNASTSAAASGIETYYYQYYPEYPAKINTKYHNTSERINRSATLANAIQSATVSSAGAKNNGVQRNTFAVLRETTAPSVLLELGYMSNAAESQKIKTSAYQEKLANGIVSGILAYYKKYDI